MVYLNGNFIEKNQAYISVMDRGFLFGDGIYEVFPVYNKKIIGLLNTAKVENAGLRVNSKGKKTILCKDHYKEWKKESKDDRDLERARFNKF